MMAGRKTVKVSGYTRSAPTPKSRAGKGISTGYNPKTGREGSTRSVKKAKSGSSYGSQPHQRLPRKGEL